MTSPLPEINFGDLVAALLDESTPFNPRFLYRLTDLEGSDLAKLEAAWPKVPKLRRQAVLDDLEELGETDSVLSFEAVGRLGLNDPEPPVRAAALRLLWTYEEPELAPKFLSMLESDEDPTVRALAASALGRFVYLGEVEEISSDRLHAIERGLLKAERGKDESIVRRRALEALGFSSLPEVKPLIEDAYESSDPDWVASALYAMGRSSNEKWAPSVLEMLSSSDSEVRVEAVRAAGELELDDALGTLLELVNDEDDDVRAAAIWSLSQIGGEGVRETLEQLQEESVDDDETEYITSAIDNLSFTEEMELFTLFDLPDDDDEDDDDELLDLVDEPIDEDDDEEDLPD